MYTNGILFSPFTTSSDRGLDALGYDGESQVVSKFDDRVHDGGVTASVLADLAAIGCDVAQGYLFTRPMPADQLAPWLTRYEPAAIGRALS